MTDSIRKLASYTALDAGDQIPLSSLDAGGDVRVALSTLAQYVRDLLPSLPIMATQYASPSATGFSVTVDPVALGLDEGVSVYLRLTPLANYAAGTIVLPPLPQLLDGQEVLVSCSQSVTALTVNGNSATVNGAPSTLAANGFFRLRFEGVENSWNRIG